MTTAYIVAISALVLIELCAVAALLGGTGSKLVLPADDASPSTMDLIQLHQSWNAVSKTTLSLVLLSTVINRDPVVRCAVCVALCLGISTYGVAMGPRFYQWETHANGLVESSVNKYYQATNYVVIGLLMTFGVVGILEGWEYFDSRRMGVL